MELPPRSTAERLISYRQFASSLAEGALVTVIVLALYFWMLEHGSAADEARTLAFVALVTANAALIFPTRSADNKWYQMFAGMSSVAAWVLGGTLAGLVAVTSIPVFAQAFAFSPPSSLRWLFACAVGASSLVVLGAAKAVFGRADAHRQRI